MVYEKSARGYTEFTNNKRTLNVRERQVLLLVNGIRALEDLEKFFKKEHLMETLEKLEAGGFIQRADQGFPASAPAATNAASAPPATDFSIASLTAISFPQTENGSAAMNAAAMEAVKTILIEATDDYLGLMGRALKTRISACDHESELRNCISSWHMAMRESKLGRESTSFLMQQIHHVLENTTEENSQENSVVELASAKTVVTANNTSMHVPLAMNAASPMAQPALPENITRSVQANSAPAQKVNASEPSGFLQHAFG